MNYLVILLSFFLVTKQIISAWRPPLPNPQPRTLAELDVPLNAHHPTVIDEIHYRLTNETLSQTDQRELDALTQEQKVIVDSYRIFYSKLIAEQQLLEFNRVVIIDQTIKSFRETIPKLVNDKLGTRAAALHSRIFGSN